MPINLSKNNLSDYTRMNIDNFKARLSKKLCIDGVSTDIFSKPECSDLKEYIINAVKDILSDPNKLALQGISFKLSNTRISGHNTNGDVELEFPTINKYQGHFLISTFYFKKNTNNTVSIEEVPFIDKGLIIT